MGMTIVESSAGGAAVGGPNACGDDCAQRPASEGEDQEQGRAHGWLPGCRVAWVVWLPGCQVVWLLSRPVD